MKTISAYQARQKFGELIETVHYRDEDVVILRSGKPMAIIISPRKYHHVSQGSWTKAERMSWMKMSQKAFETIWGNQDDAIYDGYDLAKLTPYQTLH